MNTFSVEHVLFAILHDTSGLSILEKCGGNVDNLKSSLENFFNENLQMIPEESEYVLQQTIGFQRVIQRAVNHVRSAEKKEVAVGDILALYFHGKGFPCGLLSHGRGHYTLGCPCE